jgi:uncharacterized protein
MQYRAPGWLRGPHAQTIWPALYAPRPQVVYRRVRWDTPDADFVDLDWADPPPGPGGASRNDRPLLVLFHGLEGCSSSHYALVLMSAAIRRGWQGVVVHFRGCSGEPNRLARAYHSGDSQEIDWVLARLAAQRDAAGETGPLFAAGVSLGANVLLKWLGERGDAARRVSAAAALSPPQDLHAGAICLSRGFGRVYSMNFLRTLKRKSLAKLERFPGIFDRRSLLAARDFFAFDEIVTAPLHGFASAIDYWTRSSCRQYLPGIEVPTLVVNALNDPFLPPSALARPDQVSRHVRLEYPQTGGHVGFVSGSFPGRLDWIEQRVIAHFDSVLDG